MKQRGKEQGKITGFDYEYNRGIDLSLLSQAEILRRDIKELVPFECLRIFEDEKAGMK